MEPEQIELGIAGAGALLGQPTNPARQPVPILRFALAVVRLQLLGRRALARGTWPVISQNSTV